MKEPKYIMAKGNGINIQLAEWQGDGDTVLCVHGLTANCRCWDVIADTLSPQYRVLAMDLRGRGLSDKPETGYSIEQHCKDIVCLLNNLGLEKVIMMGHSLGAFITLVFGAVYPQYIEKIILVDGGGKLSDEQMDNVMEGIKPSVDRLGQMFPSYDNYVKNIQKAPFFQDWSPALDTYFKYDIETVEGGIRSRIKPENIQEESVNLSKIDFLEYYHQINCPLLILRATKGLMSPDDLLLPDNVKDKMLSNIRASRCADITNTDHFSILFNQHEERDRFIMEFLME